MRVSEREGGRASQQRRRKTCIVQLLCRCPQCCGVNQFVLDYNSPRVYSKCQGCGEVVPTGAYKVIMLNNDLSRPIF